MHVRVSIAKVCISTILLYGSEGWILKKAVVEKMKACWFKVLRTCLGLTWYDVRERKITNDQVLRWTKAECILTMAKRKQLRWVGHISRMAPHQYPHMMLFGHTKRKTKRGHRIAARRSLAMDAANKIKAMPTEKFGFHADVPSEEISIISFL